MPLRRSLLLILPLLVAACADRPAQKDPLTLRFGAALTAAETGADALILRMDGFERMAMREDAAIAFAAGGRGAAPRLASPGTGAAEAAGQVLAPGFAALGAYARALTEAAGGEAEAGEESVAEGAVLARAAAEGLTAVHASSGAVVAEPVRAAGLAGIAALAELPARREARLPALVPALVTEAAPHVAAVTALLRAVIGPEPGQGTRGAIRARREALDAGHGRFLAAVAADRRLGPGERYTIYRSVAEQRDGDPAQGSFTAMIDLLARLDAAQAAVAAGAGDAADRVTAFEAAVARLGALVEASRRG
ncbi:MAG: hypothetical protein ACOYOH_07665 [Paracraurococcus sp.]